METTAEEIKILDIVINIVISFSFLISILLLLHLLVFQRNKDIVSFYMTKLVLWLIFCGLIKNICGVANLQIKVYITCTIVVSIIRFFAMAEQLFSFMIALELFLMSINPLDGSVMGKYFYKYTIPTICIISIATGIMNGVDYYTPGSACIIQSNALYSKICTIFFLIIFLVNMLLFIMFFIKSRKIFTQSATESSGQQISKKTRSWLLFFNLFDIGSITCSFLYCNIF